jgi:hypothetical protein
MMRAIIAGFCVLGTAAAAVLADMGRITLTDGTKLRGDISETENEVILRNAAGEARYPRSRVATIEYDPKQVKPASAPASRPASGPAAPPAASQPKLEGPEPPKLLSKRDVLRLKLSEYPLDGPPQKVVVAFPKKRGETSIEDLVAKDIRGGAELEDPDWERTLAKGKPPEKLQLILKATGLKHADRIEIRGDTETFHTFKRRVLPGVTDGCTKSGCHGGNVAHVWRFPAGLQSNDEYPYTAFRVLDQMHTPLGAMIDRNVPERSALLRYMLPPEGDAQHPTVKGKPIPPVFRNTSDADYIAVLDWINSLRVHAEYELEYEPPEWLVKLSQPPAPPSSQPEK